MPASTVSKAKRAASGGKTTAGLLYFLDGSGGRILSVKPDGSDQKVIVTGAGPIPDGIVVDAEAGHIYWTNMGVPSKNDGSIERVDLDGKNRTTIIPKGGTFTPKQLHLEKKSGKLYWCDREGMRVMRANLDGSKIETLVDSSGGDARPGPDQTKWCVGITVDPNATKSIGRKKDRLKPARAAFFARTSKSRKVRPRRTAATSKCCSTSCRSRLIWNSISKTASCIGRIVAIRRVATR
ncbi:MAG TPA: hypothetical protein VMH87_15320 [Pseudomonadales bacterium]|nr:hypothetical protein [Pseudomonadales bacterium]